MQAAQLLARLAHVCLQMGRNLLVALCWKGLGRLKQDARELVDAGIAGGEADQPPAGAGSGRTSSSSSSSSSSTGAGASGSCAPSGPPAGQQQQRGLMQQLQAALLEMERDDAQFFTGDPAGGYHTFDEMAAFMKSQLGPARRVAALVEAYYQLPERQAAAALELALAAATRDCANLRCPNVAGEGREAEGRVNKRCSACRAVRYCCSECSVVDWKAGHRRLCGALAAAAAAEAAAEEAATGEPAL